MPIAGRAGSFSTDYSLRLIDADSIGRDVNVPALPIQYRVHSRVGANASLEGRDLTYLMPAAADQSAVARAGRRGRHSRRRRRQPRRGRVASLPHQPVPDPRDGAWRHRGRGGAARACCRWRGAPDRDRQRPKAACPIASSFITSRRSSMMSSARPPIEGWTDGLTARALAALRIVAALRDRSRRAARNRWRPVRRRLRAGSRRRTAGRGPCACRSRAR